MSTGQGADPVFPGCGRLPVDGWPLWRVAGHARVSSLMGEVRINTELVRNSAVAPVRTFALAGVGIVLVLLFPVGCGQGREGAKGGPGPKTAVVTAVSVEGVDLPRVVEAVGTLQGWEEVTVSAEVSGVVERVLADLGDVVQAGQPLVQISVKELGAAFERAEGALARAEAQAEEAARRRARAEELNKRGLISRQDAEGLESEDRAARAAVKERRGEMEIARVRLANATIRAPIAGQIRRRIVSAGEFIEDKKPVMVLVSSHPLKLSVQVPERFAGEVRAGQPVEVSVEAYPGKTFGGKVTRVAPAVAVESRSFGVEAEVPNKGGVLKAGSFAKAAIRTRTDRNVPVVPESAVLTLAGASKVFVAEGGKARARNVETGRRTDGRIEIAKGVKPGERVLVSGHARVSDGDAIDEKKEVLR